MKILTPEEEKAHDRETWKGGLLGGLGGLALGSLGVYAASRKYHAFRSLSGPFRSFLVLASVSFASVVTADSYSRNFEKRRHADADYQNKSEQQVQELTREKSVAERVKQFVAEQRYPIVYGSWAVGMVAAGALVGRNPYLTGQQKLVQARVYAQGLTLAVLIASFALEGNDLRTGKGRWETVKVIDPDDPEHKRIIEKKIHHESYQGEDQWMDMIAEQESKLKARGESVYAGGKKEQSNSKSDEGKATKTTKAPEKESDKEAKKDKAGQ